ncbi:MAG: hypothetical protein ACRDX8_13140 [Acidimicrobiales bacterium]
MSPDVVPWLKALFQDLHTRSPHAILWDLDGVLPPLKVRVQLTEEGPRAEIALPEDRPLARLRVAERVQRQVHSHWEVDLPPCPDHGTGLKAVLSGEEIRWRCPHGDVDCAAGDYQELLWPPGPEDERQAAPLLGDRWKRRGIRGVQSWSVHHGVVRATVHEGTDLGAVARAAAPFRVDFERVPPVGWARQQDPDGETLMITNAPMHLAQLSGRLHRSAAGGLQVGGTEVRLLMRHRVGPLDGPLLLDANGMPFADEGDMLIGCGGYEPAGPVRGAGNGVFAVGKITRVSTATPPKAEAVQPDGVTE